MGAPTPMIWTTDLPSLEERVARLERTQLLERSRAEMQRMDIPTGHCPSGDYCPSGTHENLGNVPHQQPVKPEPTGPLHRSSPAIGLLATFARSEGDYGAATRTTTSPIAARDDNPGRIFGPPGDESSGVPVIDRRAEEALFDIYNSKIHCRYPFLRLDHLRDPGKRPEDHWVGYFLYMIYSIGLLVGKNSELPLPQEKHKAYHRFAVTRFLSHVFARPDRLLHIQAYLLLAMHALYSPSTERIISIASATMRYCVMAQLHLADAEPDLVDAETKVRIQIRRRVFWSAYALDRVTGAMFDLPFSIPDYQITVKMYANIDDTELDDKCRRAFPDDPHSQLNQTNVSAAVHVVFCRQIQSEILNTTLHRDFVKDLESQLNWRLRILEKLDRWKSLCHRYTNPTNTGSEATKSEWLHMIYNYSLQMLYRPTKQNISGPAGDWTVKSCVQACLIFRRFQKTQVTMSEAWMAMIAQFKSGVALLYCFFATPPDVRSPTYKESDVGEAVRACSIILSLLAERWPQSWCLRDTFDILAREIPVNEHEAVAAGPGPRRIRPEASSILLANLSQLEMIIVHRDTLRMIKEIATQEFPRLANAQNVSPGHDADEDGHHGHDDNSSLHTAMTGDIFQPITPHFLMPELAEADADNFEFADLGFPGIFDERAL
jgi:hypothetical protein